jgi:hypothetical protein
MAEIEGPKVMTKTFCDVCGRELDDQNAPRLGANGSRLQATVGRLTVEVVNTLDGATNTGDVCRHCILDALYALDDRPQAVSDPTPPPVPASDLTSH